MSLRILADENVDQRLVHRLTHFGHDVSHVDFVSELGKGSDDATIAHHSLVTERITLMNDDDFLTEFSADEYHGLTFIEVETLSAEHAADSVHSISEHVEPNRLGGVLSVSPTWL